MPPGAEGDAAGLASEGLDPLALAVGPVTDEGMNPGVRVALVGAAGMGTGEASGVDLLGGTAAAPDLAPGTDRRPEWGIHEWGRLLLATGRTVVRGAGFEQPVDRDTDGAARGRGPRALKPGVDQPQEAEEEQQQNEAPSSHQRPLVR